MGGGRGKSASSRVLSHRCAVKRRTKGPRGRRGPPPRRAINGDPAWSRRVRAPRESGAPVASTARRVTWTAIAKPLRGKRASGELQQGEAEGNMPAGWSHHKMGAFRDNEAIMMSSLGHTLGTGQITQTTVAGREETRRVGALRPGDRRDTAGVTACSRLPKRTRRNDVARVGPERPAGGAAHEGQPRGSLPTSARAALLVRRGPRRHPPQRFRAMRIVQRVRSSDWCADGRVGEGRCGAVRGIGPARVAIRARPAGGLPHRLALGDGVAKVPPWAPP